MNTRPRIAEPQARASASPLALRLEEAAAAIQVSPRTFEEMVARGLMPRPVQIPGFRLVRYDAESVRNAWEALKEAAGEAPETVQDGVRLKTGEKDAD